MRFHVVGLAHTRVMEGEFESCAFTQKVLKFGKMMTGRGHEVVVYSAERGRNDDQSNDQVEYVNCLSEEDRKEIVGNAHYTRADWSHPLVFKFMGNVITSILDRIAPGDFVCLIGGISQKLISDVFVGKNEVVEFGIGYGGSFARNRVFESSSWMHLTYGAEGGRSPNDAKASWRDDVIPNYFELEKLPFCESPERPEYAAFMGRLNPDKGLYVAEAVAKDLGLPFRFAGPLNGHTMPSYGDYVGELSGTAKAEFLGRASVILCPSTYIEPFCGVAVEAQLCGTPVVSTDWGAFRENIAFGRTGFRARTNEEFKGFVRMAMKLSRAACREWALQFTLEPVGQRYENYFNRLNVLGREKGWYS